MGTMSKNLRKRQKEWLEGSKRGARCPMCKRSFGGCLHSVVQVDEWFKKMVLSQTIRDEIEKYDKARRSGTES